MVEKIVTLDFETCGIEDPPSYPPEPVGLAIRYPTGKSEYLAWGHPEGNNSTKEKAFTLLRRIWFGKDQMLFHHSKFDLEVARVHFGLAYPDPLRVEDSLYHLFLNEPLAPTLSLKPSAARLLHLPPDEQDAVRNWLVAHGVVHATAKDWGAHIAKAPGDLVGTYAIGDVDRTYGLLQLLAPQTHAKGMDAAYDRERRLNPILVRNEDQGIRVDVAKLEHDFAFYSGVQEDVNSRILKALNATDINLDSAAELAGALRSAGKTVSEDQWPRTPTGKLSTARDVLHGVITDPALFQLIAYRGALRSCLTTFFTKWVAQSRACEGRVHPAWNSVRGETGGTRTGRLSCYRPNFQNVPKVFEEAVPKGLPPLPLMRRYVLPDPDQLFVSADFHSQEVRVLGHYAEGAIQQIYQNDPSADVHAVAADLIRETSGIEMSRKNVKIIAFSILYGAGITKLAESLGVDRGTAAKMKRAYLNVLTGVEELQREIEELARTKIGVRTWGGRILQAPPSEIRPDGGVWNKDYVLVNYLIQGSAADQTKESIIRYDSLREHGRFLLTVHDEICISVPRSKLKSEIKALRAAMEDPTGWDLPMRAEVSVGKNWQDMEVTK